MINKINDTRANEIQTQAMTPTKYSTDGISEQEKEENRDEYISSEEKKPIGLYSVSPDDDGGRRVTYDAPDNSAERSETRGNDDAETATANTDKVDREIKKLREKSQALSDKLRSADPESADRIRSELDAVSRELAQKDNDLYRRQNTVFS